MTSKSGGCAVCVLFGAIIPWSGLFVGGILGLLPNTPPAWDRLSAYMVAISLLLMAGSFVLRRVPRIIF